MFRWYDINKKVLIVSIFQKLRFAWKRKKIQVEIDLKVFNQILDEWSN